MPLIYDIVTARFKFLRPGVGPGFYTIEYHFALRTWCIFNNDETTGAVFMKKLKKRPKERDITMDAADTILHEYLNKVAI